MMNLKPRHLALVLFNILVANLISIVQSQTAIAPPAGGATNTTGTANENQKPNAWVTAFTDFNGLSGDNPNGLVQTELFANFPMHKGDKPLRGLENFAVGFNLTKIENNLRYKQLYYSVDDSDSTQTLYRAHLNYLDLIRYQNMETYVKLNLLKLRLDKFDSGKTMPFTFFLDFMANVISTGIRDTLNNSDNERNSFRSVSFGWGGAIKAKSNFISNELFPVDVVLEYSPYILYNTSNNFTTTTAPLFSPEDNPKNSEYFGAKKLSVIQRYMIMLRYNPDYKKSSNEIFLRVQIHQNWIDKEFTELGSKHNTFLQVQLGYSADIKSLIPPKN